MKPGQVWKLHFWLFAVIAHLASVFGQVGPGLRHESDADGLTVHGPAGEQYFRMRITGRNAGRIRTKKKYWYRSDEVRFEFFSEDITNFVMTNIPRRLDDLVVLELYRSEFLRRNGDLKVRTLRFRLANGEDAIYWSYDKPIASPNGQHAKQREMFLVISGPGYIFGLFAPVPPGLNERGTRGVITRILGTLRISEQP